MKRIARSLQHSKKYQSQYDVKIKNRNLLLSLSFYSLFVLFCFAFFLIFSPFSRGPGRSFSGRMVKIGKRQIKSLFSSYYSGFPLWWNFSRKLTLREKCPYLKFFWPAFSRIRTEYGKTRIRENKGQKNSEYGRFPCSEIYSFCLMQWDTFFLEKLKRLR